MATTTLFVDAAYAGNQTQMQAAIAQGATGCGYYLPNQPPQFNDPLNQWTPAEVRLAYTEFKQVVGIWLPDYSLPEDPTLSAQQAYTSAVSVGESPTMSGLYNGNHIAGVTGPVWLPIPGSKPGSVGALSAIQWGQATIDGWSVDLDIASTNFPWNKCIMVDFEAGTNPDLAWYQAFQAEIAKLAVPITSVPTGGNVAGNVLTFGTTIDANEQAFWTDSNGNLRHAWFDKATFKWIPSVVVVGGCDPAAEVSLTVYDGIYQVWTKLTKGGTVQVYWSGTEWAPVTVS